jgi:polyisoprenoid-binding protein YceI
MPETVTDRSHLERLRRQDPGLVLLDVRLADDHAACHLPGALNNCVFEVAFLDRMRGLAASQQTPLCVYGHGEDSLEADEACAKLERAGYTRVHVLTGGLDAWRAAGGETAGAGEPPPAAHPWPAGRSELDPGACRVEWLGRNLLNSHWGTVETVTGHVVGSADGLEGGEIVLDLRSLVCADLAGTDLHDVMIAHLASDDFFFVERWPTARYVIRAGRFLADAAPGAPNLRITGDLTLRGVTAPLAFTAVAGVAPDGRAGAQATVVCDRTRWGVNYGSGRLFRRLAGHLVNDEIELRLRLVLAT